ncbi:unnamed protein product [Orchesella dallaii]|uniref:Uncharacterized protein n=1 Tax=Orchesella dallaii TaxID=48710 RepID=A0ABP1SAX5_9HEXA
MELPSQVQGIFNLQRVFDESPRPSDHLDFLIYDKILRHSAMSRIHLMQHCTAYVWAELLRNVRAFPNIYLRLSVILPSCFQWRSVASMDVSFENVPITEDIPASVASPPPPVNEPEPPPLPAHVIAIDRPSPPSSPASIVSSADTVPIPRSPRYAPPILANRPPPPPNFRHYPPHRFRRAYRPHPYGGPYNLQWRNGRRPNSRRHNNNNNYNNNSNNNYNPSRPRNRYFY